MKKIVILIIVLLLTSFFLKAQIPPICPLGWTQGSIQLTAGTSPSCTYKIHFCYKCTGLVGSDNRGIELKITATIPRTNLCTKPSGEILDALEHYIVKLNHWQDLCGDYADKPPCIEGFNLLFTVSSPMCWKKVHDPFFYDPEFSLETGIVYLVPCTEDTSVCERVWRICWDTELIPPDYKICIISHQVKNGPPTCGAYNPKIEDPLDPLPDQESVCFPVVNPCSSPGDFKFCPQ
jgi:hypothetical protein